MCLSENKSEVSVSEQKVQKKYVSDWETAFGLERHVWTGTLIALLHLLALRGLLMIVFGQVPRSVALFVVPWGYLGSTVGMIGAHRYWSHKTFKAKLPLQIFMAYFHTLGGHYPIFKWCRNHALHHKYVDKDADPHNSSRGFWFSYIGWLYTREHPAVTEMAAKLDLSELDNDPLIRFQSRYYFQLVVLCNIIPHYVLHTIWPSMSFYQVLCVNLISFAIIMQATLLVNSITHLSSGSQPYDTGNNSRDNAWLNLLLLAEGWHNFHHAFPGDYRSSEWGFHANNWNLIDFFAWTGQAYDLKTASPKMVAARAKRTGDGTYPMPHDKPHSEEDKAVHSCGKGDDDMFIEDYHVTELLNKGSG